MLKAQIDPDLTDYIKKAVLQAALLHDVLEDCGVTRRELETEFGVTVADLVWRVTDEPGVNRKTRHLNTYWKIRENQYATLIKIADRIENMQTCFNDKDDSKGRMYHREYPSFKAALFHPHQNQNAWFVLDGVYAQVDKMLKQVVTA